MQPVVGLGYHEKTGTVSKDQKTTVKLGILFYSLMWLHLALLCHDNALALVRQHLNLWLIASLWDVASWCCCNDITLFIYELEVVSRQQMRDR